MAISKNDAAKAAQHASETSQAAPIETPKVETPNTPMNRFMVKFPVFTFALDAGAREYPQQKDRSGNAVVGTEHLVQASAAKVDLPLGDDISLEATIYRHDDKKANLRNFTFSFPKGFKVPKQGPAAIELERFKQHVLDAFEVQLDAWEAGAAPAIMAPVASKQPRLVRPITK